jgi:hypothetical protein
MTQRTKEEEALLQKLIREQAADDAGELTDSFLSLEQLQASEYLQNNTSDIHKRSRFEDRRIARVVDDVSKTNNRLMAEKLASARQPKPAKKVTPKKPRRNRKPSQALNRRGETFEEYLNGGGLASHERVVAEGQRGFKCGRGSSR